MKFLPVSDLTIEDPAATDPKVLDERIRKIEKYIQSEKESLKYSDEQAYKELLLIIDLYEELRKYERASIFEKAYKVAEFLIPLEAKKQ